MHSSASFGQVWTFLASSAHKSMPEVTREGCREGCAPAAVRESAPHISYVGCFH